MRGTSVGLLIVIASISATWPGEWLRAEESEAGASIMPRVTVIETTEVQAPESAKPAPPETPAPAKPAPSHSSGKGKSKGHAAPSRTAAPKAKMSAPVADTKNFGSGKFLFDEALNLLVANQKYLMKFEDEESYGRIAVNTANSMSLNFSIEDVEKYRDAIQKIADYRNQIRHRCLGSSARLFSEAIDQYFTSLAAFNRRALPLVADISENNNTLVLIVNRTTLIDAPILISRFLQFKKQRFKENMGRFLPADTQLIASMVAIARVLKVEISEEDWNKTYGVRDNALELISAWPREMIFEATEKLADTKETACIVELPLKKGITPARNSPIATPPAGSVLSE